MTSAGKIDYTEDRGLDLPRPQEGSSPQRLILRLFTDYWPSHEDFLPSAAFVDLGADFGVTTVGARAALSRLGKRNLVESKKVGRNTYYRLSAGSWKHMTGSARRVMAFGTQATWDGLWTVVVFSLPEERRNIRYVTRCRLRLLGFAPLYDGTWVSPTATPEATYAALDDLELGSATVLRAQSTEPSATYRQPIEAWDLEDIRASYDSFLAEARIIRDLVDKGDITPVRALVGRLQMMEDYRRFLGLDPELPDMLMPTDWPRSEARTVFTGLQDELAPLAEMRVKQILRPYGSDVVDLVKAQTAADILASEAGLDDGPDFTDLDDVFPESESVRAVR